MTRKLNLKTAFFIGICCLYSQILFSQSTENDTIPPAPVLNIGSLTASGPFNISIGFTEPVVGLETTDFFVENGMVTNLTGNGTNYLVTITPQINGLVRFSIPPNVAVDAAGNGNSLSGTLMVTYTASAELTVALSTEEAQVAAEFPILVEFNRSVTGLAISDFNISNGAGTELQGSGNLYTLLIQPTIEGEIAVFLPAGTVQDVTGEFNLGSNALSVHFGIIDVIAPQVVLQTDNTLVNGPFWVTIKFDEPILDLQLADFVVENATAEQLIGTGQTFSLALQPLEAGEITLQLPANTITDIAGNPNEDSNQLSLMYEIPDTIAPTVSFELIDEPAYDQLLVKVVFSEPVFNFSMDDLLITNGVGESLNEAGQDYILTVLINENEMVAIQLPADKIKDAAGNSNAASVVWEWLAPVEIIPVLDLSLMLLDDGIQLDWSTNTDAENDFFVISYSTDDINFSILDTIWSDQLAGIALYQFKDLSPNLGMNYYQIYQHSQLGTSFASELLSIEFIYQGPDALVYPSPANQHLTLNTTPYVGKRCEVMIFNSLGQIHFYQVYEALPFNPIELDISRFQVGVYGIQFWIKETERVEDKFLIMR